jgi:hypothetical protein
MKVKLSGMLHHGDWKYGCAFIVKCKHLFTSQHGVTSHKTLIVKFYIFFRSALRRIMG